MGHLLRVWEYAYAIKLKYGYISVLPAERLAEVALLHDAMEDKCITDRELRALGYDNFTMMALRCLDRSRFAGLTYHGWIAHEVCRGGLVSVVVKLADLQDNLSETRVGAIPPSLRARYQQAYNVVMAEMDARVERRKANLALIDEVSRV